MNATDYIFEAMGKQLKAPAIASAFITIAGLILLVIPKRKSDASTATTKGPDSNIIRILGCALMLFGGYYVYNTYSDYSQVTALRDNRAETCATTMTAETVSNGSKVKYTYKVNGQEYTGSRIRFDNELESYLLKDAGLQYVVIYNKLHPETAVLDAHRPLADCQ